MNYIVLILLIILIVSISYQSLNRVSHLETFLQNDLIPKSEEIRKNMEEYLKKNNIPAGQVCIIHNNQIVYNDSYGNTNCTDKTINGMPNVPITNNNVFRIASCSKPITAMGILYLINQNKLRFTDKVFQILSNKRFININTIIDNRIKEINILHLLRHEGGWDMDKHFEEDSYISDPQGDALRIATKDESRPATNLEIIQYMITQPLDFQPGTKSVYSNFGYNILGRVIEAISGQNYEDFIKQHIFSTVGVTNAYIGSEILENRRVNEVMYCDQESNQRGYSIHPHIKYPVPISYGKVFSMRVMDSHGGWVMNATSLAKFGNGIITNKYMGNKLFNAIYNKPNYVTKGSTFYSLGLIIESKPNGVIFSHAGALIYGTFSMLIIIPKHNLVIASIFNHLTDAKKMGIDLVKILIPSYY